MDVRRLLGTVLLVCAGRSLKSRGVDGEQAVNCTVKKDNFYPPEWLEGHSFIPADLYDLKVELVTTPYLNICWTLSASGSITYLKATFIQLYILEEDMTEEVFGVRCNYRELFKKSKSPNGELWRFCHDTFPLKPNTEYSIRAFNIPVAKITDDQPSKSFHYKSPGCTDPIMMYSESCVPTGIPWNPNITACILEKNVEVNFTAHSPGTEHIIQLHNCLSPSELPSPSCTLIDLYKVTENSKSRISLLINGTTELAYAVVVVYPLLPTCQNDCKRHQKMVDCIHITAPEPAPRTNLPIILLSALFVVCGIAVALYCISGIMPFLVNETGLHPPVRVLLTYPKESAPFLKTVLSFADFLHEYCKADVFLDLWQKRKVADVGQVQWLVTQKEMADKIIFLSSSGRSNLKIGSPAETKRNHTDADTSENMFPLALNLFCSDLISQSSLQKYMVVYFSEINPKGNLPSVLQTCSKYCLMKDIDVFCKDLRTISHNPLPISKTLAPNNKKNGIYLQKLQKAILEHKQWLHGCPSFRGEELTQREHLLSGFI
ncbi:interleukin-17 receptor B isoform X2 [Pleurodeles waltl]|uniref:interleukin-17 receptor B isoform X2 n=1 Tax=Pleurodeles waltl TaxID=8319 RepID=UPI0037095A20